MVAQTCPTIDTIGARLLVARIHVSSALPCAVFLQEIFFGQSNSNPVTRFLHLRFFTRAPLCSQSFSLFARTRSRQSSTPARLPTFHPRFIVGEDPSRVLCTFSCTSLNTLRCFCGGLALPIVADLAKFVESALLIAVRIDRNVQVVLRWLGFRRIGSFRLRFPNILISLLLLLSVTYTTLTRLGFGLGLASTSSFPTTTSSSSSSLSSSSSSDCSGCLVLAFFAKPSSTRFCAASLPLLFESLSAL